MGILGDVTGKIGPVTTYVRHYEPCHHGHLPEYFPALSTGIYFQRPITRRNKRNSPGRGQSIVFTWDDNSGKGTAHSNDRVILVACLPQEKTAFFIFGDENRSDCRAVLIVPPMSGQIIHTWLGFISHDEKNTAISVYKGELEN